MDVLDAATALTGRDKWVILRGIVHPAEATEWKVLIKALHVEVAPYLDVHVVVFFLFLLNRSGLLRLFLALICRRSFERLSRLLRWLFCGIHFGEATLVGRIGPLLAANVALESISIFARTAVKVGGRIVLGIHSLSASIILFPASIDALVALISCLVCWQ